MDENVGLKPDLQSVRQILDPIGMQRIVTGHDAAGKAVFIDAAVMLGATRAGSAV